MELFSAESETFEIYHGEVLVNRLEVSVHRVNKSILHCIFGCAANIRNSQ